MGSRAQNRALLPIFVFLKVFKNSSPFSEFLRIIIIVPGRRILFKIPNI